MRVENTWRVSFRALIDCQRVLQGMEGVYRKGLTRAIGVSNFSIDQIERVQRTASVPIHNQQVELHLYFPQFAMQEVCKRHNISLTAYAPLGSPKRVDFKPGNK